MKSVSTAIQNRKHLLVHAPTGLGKTIGVLAPAVEYAANNAKTIFFLTSRHTQHALAVETLRDIQEKNDFDLRVADIIGKKWMCIQPGISGMMSGEFNEYCKKLREDKLCEFYVNTRENMKLTARAKQVIKRSRKILHTGELISMCKDEKLCPYEISLAIAEKARVIIADYYYIFHPTVSETFMKRSGKDLADSIVVVDEAHNLPYRVRDLASTKLSSNILKSALSECKKFGFSETLGQLSLVQDALNEVSNSLNPYEEKTVEKGSFSGIIEKEIEIKQLVSDLEFIAEDIREKQRRSYVGSIANFLSAWQKPDEGFTRYAKVVVSQGRHNTVLCNTCLDPAVVAAPVINATHSTIMMSGTLTPVEMYNDLMGFEDSMQQVYPSPFPKKNRLNVIIPKTTTKYQARSDMQFENIARVCSEVTNEVPGNSILFFPSYFIRDQVYQFFVPDSDKTVFQEDPAMGKEEREEMLEKFKKYEKTGAVLLAVASGSFSEGVDLPGDLLKCVVIVGLPLQQPDLETKELINYYDQKYGKGWDYGYIFPAFNKALQSAGRCIRSETDKGIVVFVDERYIWPRYRRLFPDDWDMEIAKDVDSISDFFKQ